MCVVDTTDSKIPLPDRVLVNERRFLIKYKGKKWFCHSCATEHVGACPYQKEFYQALEAKKAVKVKHIMLADSTLRHADHVGLRADVMCMPGATVGQLATALEEMPLDDISEISIIAGTNDVKSNLIDSEFIMAKQIDASLKRL